MKVKSLSRARLLATPRTAAYQAPPSVGFSRQEYWSGVPLPSPKEEQRPIFLFHNFTLKLARTDYVLSMFPQSLFVVMGVI